METTVFRIEPDGVVEQANGVILVAFLSLNDPLGIVCVSISWIKGERSIKGVHRFVLGLEPQVCGTIVVSFVR